MAGCRRLNRLASGDPLRIAELRTGGGTIGITSAPGKQRDDLTGRHARDLAADLDAVAAWNAAIVVTLAETHELSALGICDIGAEVQRRHMEWAHWATADYGVPDAAFAAAWLWTGVVRDPSSASGPFMDAQVKWRSDRGTSAPIEVPG